MSKVKTFYVNVPNFVKKNRLLTGDDKIIFSEIRSLIKASVKKGGPPFCWATNKYLADECGTSESTVKRAVQKLVRMKLLYAQMRHDHETKKTMRRIFNIAEQDHNAES